MAFFPISAGAIGDLVEMIVNNDPVPGPEYSSMMSRWQKLAVKLIRRFRTGRVTLIKRDTVPLVGDPTRSQTAFTATQQLYAHVSGFSDKERATDPNIHAADRKVYLAGKDVTSPPERGGAILMTDNREHTIVDVRQVPADGLVALYILQARTADL